MMCDTTLEGAIVLRLEYAKTGKLRRRPISFIEGGKVEAFVLRESLVRNDLLKIDGYC